MQKHILFFLGLLLVSLNAWAQSLVPVCKNNRFTEIPVFTDKQIQKTSHLPFAKVKNYLQQSQTLQMDVYAPKAGLDPLQKRPLVVMIFGGGFISGQRSSMDLHCRMLAQRGFVAATVDYRIGHDTTSCTDSLSYNKAVYRAVQDVHAALRYLVYKADSMRIDTSWIFAGGVSAGSATSLNLVYMSQTDANREYPTIVQELGTITSSGNPLRNKFTIKGIFNNWGAMQAAFFTPQEAVPMISFHGDRDTVAPIDCAYKGTRCYSPLICSSRSLHTRIRAAGFCSQLNIRHKGGHGVYDHNKDSTEFRVSKAACFFKSLFCQNCQSDSTSLVIPAYCSTSTSSQDGESSSYILFPNPAQTWFTIQNFIPTKNTEYKIYDSFGQLKKKVQASSILEVTDLPSGIYLLQIHNGHMVVTRKFVKE